jgi:hypothetical protein
MNTNGRAKAAHRPQHTVGPKRHARWTGIYLSARDIEAIVMCGLYIDPVEQRTWPGGCSDRSTIVEKWAAIVKRLLDFGC